MPITPFHFGPGALLKAVFPRHFSFSIFCCANVLIDCEPIFYFLTTGIPAHRGAHSYGGAVVIATLTTLIAGPIRRFIPRLIPNVASNPVSSGRAHFYWITQTYLTWPILFCSAALGTFSHILLDSLMHADIQPFRPFSAANPLLGQISLRHLHYFCMLCGLIAVLCFVLFPPHAGQNDNGSGSNSN